MKKTKKHKHQQKIFHQVKKKKNNLKNKYNKNRFNKISIMKNTKN